MSHRPKTSGKKRKTPNPEATVRDGSTTQKWTIAIAGINLTRAVIENSDKIEDFLKKIEDFFD